MATGAGCCWARTSDAAFKACIHRGSQCQSLAKRPLSRLHSRCSSAAQFLDKATEGAYDITVLPKTTRHRLSANPGKSKVALIPKFRTRASREPVKGQSRHAHQASKEPAKCRAGRTPAGHQQDVMPAGPMPASWSHKCRIDDGQLSVNLPASPWQNAGRAGQFIPKITRSIATILPEIQWGPKVLIRTFALLEMAKYIAI